VHSGPELTVVVLCLLALVLGAGLKSLGRSFPVPYTVAMLLLGIVLGELTRRFGPDGYPILTHLAAVRHGISPATIMFVFLPALIFESAFGLDVHTFARDAGSVVLLALPALLVTAGLAALAMWPLADAAGLGWGIGGALVFGALAGATDPVAVVAVLREVGAPRRLAVLIEGESLLNDGTAIVVFGTISAVFLEGNANLDATTIVLDFVRIVAGGMAVGFVLAWVTTRWIGRTFNAPMVEITLTVVLAYAAMIVGEGALHVSGVIAVVVAGLHMAGPGRTRVSPEVAKFLHRFWELAAYAANTLIFFLVGLLAAGILNLEYLTLVGLGVAAWLALVVIRFAVTFAFRPLMSRIAQPVSNREAAVLSWGGLRGAVSLALALGVATNPVVDEAFGEQILVVTATVVLMTILVNGTTTGWLLRRLGFTDIAPADAAADLDAECAALESVEARLAAVSREKDLSSIPLEAARAEVRARREALMAHRSDVGSSVASMEDHLSGLMRKALSVEMRAYWDAFSRGTLGASAVHILTHEVEIHRDRVSDGDLEAPMERARPPQGFFRRLGQRLGLLRGRGRPSFDHLTLAYDLYRGQMMAAAAVLATVPPDHTDPASQEVRRTYLRYLRRGREHLEDLRANLPELVGAVEQRLANRLTLNFERDAIAREAGRGALSARRAQMVKESIEERMKRLGRERPEAHLPETADVCRHMPLFAGLSEEILDEIAEITKEHVIAPGEVLFEEGAPGRAMHVVARGALSVLKRIDDQEVLVDVLGPGDIVGEMALLSASPRGATVVAATAATLGEIKKADFEAILDKSEALAESVHRAFVERSFDNHVRTLPRFAHLSHDDRMRWCRSGRMRTLEGGEKAAAEPGERFLFVALGRVRRGDELIPGPALVEVAGAEACEADGKAWIAFISGMIGA
jgi:NhaP-type Na+/H+ or K+/H+ antiporter